MTSPATEGIGPTIEGTSPATEGNSFAPALFLLFVAVLINYVDRGNLAIAAPLLKEEWGLSPTRLGTLFSAFFWTYTAMQFVSGWLVDRIEVSRLLALGYLVWSLATAVTGLARGFTLLLALRLLLGVGESVIFPACSKILARYLPEESRGFANGVVCSAMRCGSVVGTFGGGMMMAKYGWRPAFLAIGLLSLLWLPAWWRWRPRGEGVATAAIQQRPPKVAEILQQRSFWGVSAGHFCGNYLLYFMITWLPFYLVREQHMTMASMSKIAGWYYITDAAASFVTGWLSDRWIRSGRTATFVRKSAMGAGFALASVSLGCWAIATPHSYLYCLESTALGAGIAGSGFFAFGQTIAGAKGAGRWTGLQNGVANLAGVIGPALTGYLVERTGHFGVALAVAAAMGIAGGLAWVLVVGRVEERAWRTGETVPLADIRVA